MIAFFLPIVPPTATSQSAGKRMVIGKVGPMAGKPMFFKNDKAQDSENSYLMLCAEHRPSSPIAGPVKLQVDFVWPWRAGEPQWRRALGRAPHTARPDCSNAVKSLEDCLTKLRFWNDDSQVAIIEVSKAWGDHVGISIAITELEIATKTLPPPKAPKVKKSKSFVPGQPELL